MLKCVEKKSAPLIFDSQIVCEDVSCNNNPIVNEHITLDAIKELSELSFKEYSKRLKTISEDIYKSGLSEFSNSNQEIITKISELNPRGFSLSVTTDPSIHYTINLPNNISLFIETYLDVSSQNITLYQIFQDGRPKVSGRDSVDQILDEITHFISLNEFEERLYKFC